MKRIVATLCVAVLLSLSMTPAQAAAQASVHIAALGDSYGSGVGGGVYNPATVGSCWRSPRGTSAEVVQRLVNEGFPVEFSNVTCSGAKVNDLRVPYHGAVQLDALRPDTRLVFLQAGGNDIDFAGVVAQCLNADCADGTIPKALAKLPEMKKDLLKLVQEIKERSPLTKIILLGYGQPMTAGANAPAAPGLELDPICAPQYFSPAERWQGAWLSAALDGTLRWAAAEADITFVSPYDISLPGGLDPQFRGHSLCEKDKQHYHGFSALSHDPAGPTAILHMNTAGYETLANLVLLEAPGTRTAAGLN